ncbi:hypothetical protein JS565_02605 [Salmonella enterica subsp. enterica serovar Senftenberg]|nr:hypothetical protein [Salmonella enterica subsp. enterica serovar Senftenberg]
MKQNWGWPVRWSANRKCCCWMNRALALTRFHGASCGRWSTSWRATDANPLSTSYLDEAEQCRDVLLMNEGELLYQGEPKALTQTMAGRSFR